MYRPIDRLVCVLSSVLIMSTWAHAQLSQADYTPTNGGLLRLNLSAGTAFCNGTVVTYAAGYLTMANNTTNYVYLDPGSNCAPASNTTGFPANTIQIATVVTANSVITMITDLRNWSVTLPCKLDSSGAANCVALGTDQNIALTPSGVGVVKPRNLATDLWGVDFASPMTFDASKGNTQRAILTGDVTNSFLR